MASQRSGESREEYNARLAAYMKERYYRRREQALAYLGGECVDCGARDALEFDHRNERLKSFNIAKRLASAPWDIIVSELDKCDLRCASCHAYHTAFLRLADFNALAFASVAQ